jgi:hypothetical protein
MRSGRQRERRADVYLASGHRDVGLCLEVEEFNGERDGRLGKENNGGAGGRVLLVMEEHPDALGVTYRYTTPP